MKRDLYASVTARILSDLERGTRPWVKPWSATPGLNHPHNAATGRPYSGGNVVLLWMTMVERGWAMPRFLTYKQAADLGGHVRKGEHGTPVYFVKQLTVRDKAKPDDDDATRTVGMLRQYTVFNVAQCDGLPSRVLAFEPQEIRNKGARDPLADAFLKTTGADIREGHGEAVYVRAPDYIGLPAFAAFNSADDYYCTAFHELAHWTGHKARLDRGDWLRQRFDRHAYAAEEMIAELCAAFLCAEFSIDDDTQSAEYLAHYVAMLKADPRAFVTCASKAQAAADFLRGLALADDAQEAEAA